jgi:hypothetical protein
VIGESKADDGPELDTRTLALIRDLRNYRFKYVRPPEKKSVADFITALEVVGDGLMDEEFGPTVADAARSITGENEYTDRLAALAEDLEILRQAAQSIPTRKGRPRLPPWIELVAPILIEFYRRATGDQSGHYYIDDNANQPGNRFTVWFCKRLRALDTQITPSNCKTLIERHS